MLTCDRLRRAGGEGVSLVTFRTVAHGHVVVNAAQRRRRADALARIDALVVFARLVALALSVRNALGTAAGVRIAEEIGEARADCDAVVLATSGVRPAHSWVADGLYRRRSC